MGELMLGVVGLLCLALGVTGSPIVASQFALGLVAG